MKVAVIGGNPTSCKRALQLIERGRAKYVDERTIELLPVAIADLEQQEAGSRCSNSPTPPVVIPFLSHFPDGDTFMGQTFLHYPQPGSFREAA